NADPAPRSLSNFDTKQTRPLVLPASTDAPDLSGRERVSPDVVLALEFGRDHELLDAVLAERVGELRVAKLGGDDSFLLFLHTAAAFHRQPQRPFEVFFGNGQLGRGMDQLHQPADGLIDGVLIATAQSTTVSHSPLQDG